MGLCRKLQEYYRVFALTIRSLSHNSCRSKYFIVDAAFEPVYWFVDHVTCYIGMIFVVLVTLLTASVVIIWYVYLLPLIRTFNNFWFYSHVIVAHWLLINIVFHYFKAVFTNPGIPPQGTPMEKITSALVCRKCIQPKPPRSHHCSICNNCYLKMDHHCPWMNNCIGFYNHRYFILFCVFMWLGTLYVCFTTFDLFTYHFFHPGTILDKEKRESNSFFFKFGPGGFLSELLNTLDSKALAEKAISEYRDHPGGWSHSDGYEHLAVIYLFLLCSAVTCALGLLNMWHAYLISRGETSIEAHINTKERQKSAKRGMGYNNPYDYNWKQNWKYLLGINHNRSFLCVLFPSAHLPEGDGITWPRSKKPLYFYDQTISKRSRWTLSISKLKKLVRC